MRRPAQILLSLLLGLFLAEGVARMAVALPGLGLLDGTEPMARELTWYRHRQTLPVDPVFEHDPATGWTNRPGRHDDGTSVAHVSADGTRLTPGATDPGRTVRVGFLGDSFTFGTNVDDDGTTAAHVAERRPDVLPVNLGVPGFGADQAWVRWRAHPAARDLDAVVLATSRVMLGRTLSDFTVFAKPTVDPDTCAIEGLPLPTPEQHLAAVRWRSRLLDLVTLAGEMATRGQRNDGAVRAQGDAVMRCALAALRDAGLPVIVLHQPIRRYHPDDLCRSALLACDVEDLVPGWCALEGVTCADPTEALDAFAAEGGVIPHVTHWSSEAHDVVAGVVVEALVEAGALPAQPTDSADAQPSGSGGGSGHSNPG